MGFGKNFGVGIFGGVVYTGLLLYLSNHSLKSTLYKIMFAIGTPLSKLVQNLSNCEDAISCGTAGLIGYFLTGFLIFFIISVLSSKK